VLKVDQAFLNDIHPNGMRETILSAIANIARGLKLGLVAEGVEHREQAEYLETIGCDFAQGYLFGRPVSESGIVAMMHQRASGL
jgi:EAL domain-containing protein (putative c-di-GMP-specific phosphodiesterase class I)